MDPYLGIAALIVGIFLLAFAVPRRMRKLRQEQDKIENQHKLEQIKIRESTDGIMVELADLGRQITSQIDNKISVLQELIKQADNVIEKLENTELKTSRAPSLEKEQMKSAVTPLQEEIYKLADEGLSAKDISEKLSQKLGEVDLILGLRNRAPKSL